MCPTILLFVQLLSIQWLPAQGDTVACGGNRPRVWNNAQGSVTSRNYPLKYPNEELCEWRIEAPANMVMSIQFSEIDTEEDNDIVTVFDGADDQSPLLGEWSGEVLPPPRMVSSGQYLYIRFVSTIELGQSQRGFQLEYQRLGIDDIACTFGPHDIENIETGFLASSNWPNPYERDATCSWRIFTDSPSKIIEIDITHFETHPGDTLTIYDGGSNTSEVLGSLEGTLSFPFPSYLTSGPLVSLHFKSQSGFISLTGWRLLWHAFEDDTACHLDGQRVITDQSGTISSRNFPNYYPANETCQWLIQGSLPYQLINFEIKVFDTLLDTDIVTLYDGPTTGHPLLLVASGDNPEILFVQSSGPDVLLTFTSGARITDHNGWTANFNISEHCADIDEACPDWAQEGWCSRCSYHMDNYCRGSCNTCTKQNEKERLLHSGHLMIEEACGPSQPKLLGTTVGEITSRNFPNDYARNEECSWRINAPPGEVINLDFSHFELGDTGAYLAIYDSGTADEGLLLARYYQDDTIASLITSGNQMLVKFSTDDGFTGLGFRVLFSRYEDDTACRPGRPRVINATTPGLLQSRNWPNYYPTNEYCEWLIQSDEGDMLDFNFDFFSTRYCSDQVRLYDGRAVNDTLLQVSCGDVIPPQTTSTSNNLLITFEAAGDDATNHEGFRGRYGVTEVCADWDPLCPVWASAGWCDRCGTYMRVHCEDTCNSCPRDTS